MRMVTQLPVTLQHFPNMALQVQHATYVNEMGRNIVQLSI